MRNARAVSWTGAALAAWALAAGQHAMGCAMAFSPGEAVQVVDEAAVILWNPATQTEQFIRRATFATTSQNLGFLVPTPTKPKLTEADNNVFEKLEQMMLPEERTEHRYHPNFTPLLLGGSLRIEKMRDNLLTKGFVPYYDSTSASFGASSQPAVRLLDSAQVGGYDAVVLEADDANALTAWLRQHGYDSRPALTAWLQPYIASHWKITAFKIARKAQDEEDGDLTLPAVRLTFQTPKPFYPYREPEDSGAKRPGVPFPSERSLRVFFLSDARVRGRMGSAAAGPAWIGDTTWADRLSWAQCAALTKQLGLPSGELPGEPLPGQPVPDAKWLTVMEDHSSPRPGYDEVYFAPAETQERIVPPPIIHYEDDLFPLPVDLLLVSLLSGGGLLLWARSARRRRFARAVLARDGVFTGD